MYIYKLKKIFLIIFYLIVLFNYFFLPSKVLALTFDITGPTEQLQKDQEVKFIINIDTKNQNYSSTSIGLKYDTQYLEFLSVLPGNTFSAVSSKIIENGKLIINGSSSSSYNGSGIFAYVNFKIIAVSAGSTQLCSLFNPQTPTSQPPTNIPKMGETKNTNQNIIIGLLFLTIASSTLIFLKNV
ncbi:MAG: cohesin domain-containing protein [Patescibacteria group bacterium]|nr:cohesin domain-containing protein [Patescibacteria group bacterium]